MNPFAKLVNVALLVTSLTLLAASCGKKEAVKPPDGATYPRQYPRP